MLFTLNRPALSLLLLTLLLFPEAELTFSEAGTGGDSKLLF